jgi:hypothetical protein
MLTFWIDLKAIKRFAGQDFERASITISTPRS